jgi:hypothetical protein
MFATSPGLELEVTGNHDRDIGAMVEGSRHQHMEAGTVSPRQQWRSPPPTGSRSDRSTQQSRQVIVLIHWRIKPEPEHVEAFLAFWQTKSTVDDRTGLIGEFLSETLGAKDFPWITWHMDPDGLADHKSFVNVGMWTDEKAFHEQIGKNFNDDRPMLPFEKYRRLRIVLRPKCWRMGHGRLPAIDSSSVL